MWQGQAFISTVFSVTGVLHRFERESECDSLSERDRKGGGLFQF